MPSKRLESPKGFGYGGGGGGDIGSGGYSGPESGGGGGGALDALISGAGNLLSNAVSDALGNLGGQALSQALLDLGLPDTLVNVLTGAAGLASQAASEANAGPSIRYATEHFMGRAPFDPGGFGGGVLTATPYLGQAGLVARDLLRSKKVSLNQLLSGGNSSVLAKLYQRYY